MALFDPLLSTRDGTGNFHLSRFRIYFRLIDKKSGECIPIKPSRLYSELRDNFQKYFNPNLARFKVEECLYNKRHAASFQLSAKLLGIDHKLADIVVPDWHLDWVGSEYVGDRSFTFQTLKRNFETRYDKFIRLGTYALIPGGPQARFAATQAAIYFNQHHFLAGRRSWSFGSKNDFGNHAVNNFNDIPADSLVLETAAVERFSKLVFEWLSQSNILGDFHKQVRSVWFTNLKNFLQEISIDNSRAELVNSKVWHNEPVDGVCFTEVMSLADLNSVVNCQEYEDVKKHHPSLLPIE